MRRAVDVSRAGSMARVTDQDGTLSNASLHLKVILGIKIDKGSQATKTKTKRDEWLASGRDVLGGLRLPPTGTWTNLRSS